MYDLKNGPKTCTGHVTAQLAHQQRRTSTLPHGLYVKVQPHARGPQERSNLAVPVFSHAQTKYELRVVCPHHGVRGKRSRVTRLDMSYHYGQTFRPGARDAAD